MHYKTAFRIYVCMMILFQMNHNFIKKFLQAYYSHSLYEQARYDVIYLVYDC